jgi:hypothetical protein
MPIFGNGVMLNSSLKTRALRKSTTPSQAGLDLGWLDLILVENATMEGDIRSKTIELKRVPLIRLPSHKKLARSLLQIHVRPIKYRYSL